MSYIEKEKLIKADIASIENRVRHAFNQGYDLGYKEGKANCSEIPTGSTTKNNLGVDYTINVLDDFIEFGKKAFGVELTIKKSNNPDTYAKLFGTTKNNLGVDCISRTQAQTEIEMNASRYTIAKERGGMGQVEWSDQLIKVSDAVDIIRKLPSVTPQEPQSFKWCTEKEQ